VVRTLTDEDVRRIRAGVELYVAKAAAFASGLTRIDV
jgi:hypothetical protein